MIRVTEQIHLDDSELEWKFVRASGPGGQHVNKSATAAQLRFDVANSPSLPGPVRARLVRLLGKRINKEGVLVIDSRGHRSQDMNREEAIGRLVFWITQAAAAPKRRRKTRPSLGAKRRRLESKKRQSEKKKFRRPVGRND